MKKILLFTSLIFLNTLAFARDYEQKTGSCSFWVTEQDMFNAETNLPFNVQLDYILAFDAQTDELLGSRAETRRQVNATTPVSVAELEEIMKGFKFVDNNGDVQVNMNITGAKLTRLFIYAGAYRLSFNKKTFSDVNATLKLNQNYRLQAHLPPNEDYGLSYHLNIKCELSDENPDQSKPDQSKPDQSKPDQSKPDQSKPNQGPVQQKPVPGQDNSGSTTPARRR